MMGGSDTGSGGKDVVVTAAIHVPIGWQRRVHGCQVVYVSPSGTSLSNLDEVKTYLLTDGTCKCGLECPLVINKVFNFTLGVKVEQHKQPSGKAEQDMTKLCNHRRKVVAMAALCRSMQASQLPLAHLHHSEVSKGVGNCNPKRAHVEREEENRGIYHPKLHPAPTQPQNNSHPNPCPSPNSAHKFIYPYNGSNSHHSLDALRRLQHPPLSHTVPSSPTFPAHHVAQRSPRTPTTQNVSQGQKTAQTPETPPSPLLRPLPSPPCSSPKNFFIGGSVSQTQAQHPRGVVGGSSPLPPSPILSPSVHNMNCVSPQQRSRHPSASPSHVSDQGGSSTAVAEGLTASNLSRRRKSCSSSPHSPLPCGSPKPSPHIFKFKLEDILEQFKNSGNSSTNNHHLPTPPNANTMTNQSSHSPHAASLKPPKSHGSVPPGFGLNPTGMSSATLGPFSNHPSHQGQLPPSTSFPASTLLSAAAKAQLASQVTQGQGSNVACGQTSVSSSLEILTEAQQKQPTKVTNSTLKNSHLSSPLAAARPQYPSLAAASSVLFPSSHSLAQSLASSLPQLPPKVEQNASHRKRRRRSPTVLSIIRDTQQLANGPQKTPPGDSVSATAVNLSSSDLPRAASTSDAQNPNSVTSERHHLPPPGQPSKFLTSKLTTHLCGTPRQADATDITTGSAPTPLTLDPPTQPLSALLHLLSVQNAQAAASASNPAPAHLGSLSVDTKVQSPTLSPSSVTPHPSGNHPQPPSPCRTSNTNTTPLLSEKRSPPRTPTHVRSMQSQAQSVQLSPLQRHSSTSAVLSRSNLALHNNSSPSVHITPTPADGHHPTEDHVPATDTVSRVLSPEASPQSMPGTCTTTAEPSQSQGGAPVALSTSPKPLDLSNHVLALLAASSNTRQEDCGAADPTADVLMSSQENRTAGSCDSVHGDLKNSTPTKPLTPTSQEVVGSPQLVEDGPQTPSAMSESNAPLPLAEAFPFMNQDQLLQLLSSTGGLPSILDPTTLSSLHIGGLWLGGQNAQVPPATGAPQNMAEQQPLMMQAETQQQSQDQQQKQQQINSNPLFPLLPLLSGVQGDLPLNLLGLLNPIPPPASATGQESDLGLTEKPSLQALLMASLLLGQNQAPLLPLSGLSQLGQVSLEVPLQQPPQIPATLEGLTLDKAAALLDPSSLQGPGLLEVTQGLPLPPGAEGSVQALQSLLLPAALPPHPATFLPFSPTLLTAALNTADLAHTQLTPIQHTQPQELSDAGVDTLIPLSLQGKENPILQQLLPTLLNPAVLGDISGIPGLHNMVGIGAGSILLPSVQTSSLGMPLMQGPDGTINLLNNIQLNLAASSEGEKSDSLQETQSPVPQGDIPAPQISPNEVASPAPPPAQEPSRPPQRVSDGRPVIDPYTSFMDTIYTSFLQINAKEQEDGVHSGPSDPTSPFCALPPVTFPMEPHSLAPPAPTQHQASAPVSLSPRRACSLRNPDLSRLSLEAAAHSPAQGTPKPTEDVATSPLQRKTVMVEGHTHPEPPLPSVYLEEAKTEYTGVERQAGYLSSGDACGGGRPREDTPGMLLHTEHAMEQSDSVSGARRGRKRKQTLHNVLEDFRDADATTALEETKAATAALLKPDTSIRSRRRRGVRSQRQ